MPQRRSGTAAAWDEAVEDLAPSPRGPQAVDGTELERLTAQGIPARMVQNIKLELNRDDYGRLLQFIEERATRSENYLEIRQAVLFSEMLRKQVKGQGA